VKRLAAALFLFGWMMALSCSREEIPTVEVELGDFQVRLVEAGVLSALHSTTISVPQIRMSFQILWLVDEGTLVESGDTLVRFDPADTDKQVEEREADLEIAIAALRKGKAEHESQMATLRSTLTYDSISWKLSRLRAERTRYESEVAKQEAELAFHQSTLSLEKSQAQHEAQLAIGAEQLNQLELKVDQAQTELDKAMKYRKQMVITAPQRGMVVYLPIWKGDRMGKVKAGDSPWRGASILELPDFDTMLVDLSVSEVDYNLITVDDSCEIVLDAWPDKRFHGVIRDVGVLAREREDDSGLKAFDVTVLLHQSDPSFKPGMNARVSIFGYREENALSLPVEALNQDEESWHVWLPDGQNLLRRNVEPGPSNGDRVLIRSGLEAGDRVSLLNPGSLAARREAEASRGRP
jgi:HlyD family secretion protein